MAVEGRRRRGSLVGPVILIGLGILFLLNNLGLLSWSVWEVIFRLWPVLLIAVGLELLVGRGSVWASLLVLVAVLVIAGAAMWALVPVSAIGAMSGGEAATERISQGLEVATRADVELGAGVGRLRIGPMPEADGLIEGTLSLGSGDSVSRDFEVRGGTAYFRLRAREGGPPWFTGRWGAERLWDLKLSPGVPMRLTVNTGVGESTLDLARSQVTDLSVNAGVGKTTLTLPAQGQVQARVEGGVGEVNVTVPEGVAARIRVDTGIGDVQVAGNYTRQGDSYVSPNFETAQNRVDLRVNGGVGRISVR